MRDLSSELHLYQRPMYRGTDGSWHKSYWDALRHSEDHLTWDAAGILSLMSFNYICGDRTLIEGVARKPWLSRFDCQGQCILSEIPAHSRLWDEPIEIAKNFGRLLYEEAYKVCQGRKEIYILLSGGLDSRVVAGTVAHLYSEGKLLCKPCAVTWGLEDSRDVAYGRAAAEILGLEWIHIGIGPDDVVKNIEMTVSLGTLFSPPHLHRMSWFKNVSSDALVLSGSYGDSVGRAVYGGKHLLELDYLSPSNQFGLIKPEICEIALKGVNSELTKLRERTPGAPKYVICEHEMQAHYMRGMIAQPMSLIENYCALYQMFTDPSVYSYIWSIHPSLRDDRIYGCLLEQLNKQLLRLPWARTNRSLEGKTVGAKSNLRKDFHSYPEWISGPLYEELEEYIDPDWFAETGIFDAENIREFSRRIKYGRQGSFMPYDRWLWLASFRRFAERCAEIGKQIELETDDVIGFGCPEYLRGEPQDTRSWFHKILGRSETVCTWHQKVRCYFLKRKARREYPPQLDK